MPPNQHAPQTPTDFSFPPTTKETVEEKSEAKPDEPTKVATPKAQDFEEHFTPEIIPAASISDPKPQSAESKMSITSLSQGSGATVTIPSHANSKDAKKKTPERFSLKTSIPISKIDMKCVSNPPDAIYQNAISKKIQTPFNPAFQNPKDNRLEIQSNIVIKNAQNEPEVKTEVSKPTSSTLHPIVTTCSNNISALLNAAETINKTDNQFWKPEAKPSSPTEAKELPTFTPQVPVTATKTIYNPVTTEASKLNFTNKPPDTSYGEQKNQILFIQNKNTSNPKMLLTIQQQNPQVLLQRSNFESKNLQAPSRLSGQIKKSKEEHLNENGTSSKVVALKRLHQENCDENDFENLITENQIYGNKIVVKEKSGTLQEQDLKKNKDKQTQETKNVVLQPNFLYLSNVQFPANLMMIKNNKIGQTADAKPNKTAANENKTNDANNTSTETNNIKSLKTQNVTTSKEIHVLKSSNNVLQTLANKTNKTDIVFQTSNQKVIMNPQIVYQVPMIVDPDNKMNQPFINREYPKFVTQNKKEFPKPLDTSKSDKLFIACPYQMDSKLQPKIVITNIRPKITKVEEISSLDMYEKRRRIRRLKYLSNRDTKETPKPEIKKTPEKADTLRNIITPDKMKGEIYKEFANTKIRIEEDSSDSDSDYGENDLREYNAIIDEFSKPNEVETGKIEFLASFRLATQDAFKEKQLDREERSLTRDAVASAYITAGRLDRLCREEPLEPPAPHLDVAAPPRGPEEQHPAQKQMFLTQLQLTQVPPKYKDGYEKAWQVVLQERKRRNGTIQEDTAKKPCPHKEIDLDPNGQLQLLTEIKKCVNENNNLIKKRLDSSCDDGESDIHALAEKNFSELDRLSKMADRSVKLYSGVDSRKRDLNPGFDSENIQKPIKVEQPYLNYPKINIPNLSKIISLKSVQESAAGTSSPATSMDEPLSSAAGVGLESERREAACQVEEPAWPGIETLIKNYKEFEAARKKEISTLHRRNTRLRVECAQTTRAAAAEAERARALLAERRQLAREEAAARAALTKLAQAVDAIRKYC
ncbi:uncharacterized protein LOC134800531 [Cydia splendana]|uniref:uncharacterized protein LOC134800531 n=1 Tax=Cydia splendana TaxID=1100963 RepID=UPI00300CE711